MSHKEAQKAQKKATWRHAVFSLVPLAPFRGFGFLLKGN
jgi:hypothetical protein